MEESEATVAAAASYSESRKHSSYIISNSKRLGGGVETPCHAVVASRIVSVPISLT